MGKHAQMRRPDKGRRLAERLSSWVRLAILLLRALDELVRVTGDLQRFFEHLRL
jgi:hypothetical protein